MTEYTVHELALVLPRLKTADEYELHKSLFEEGQIDPIILYEGKILDGRHRYDWCLSAEVEPWVEVFEGTWEEALGFVKARASGRNLDVRERAIFAANLANLSHGGDRKSQDQTADRRFDHTIDEAAEIADVSPRMIEKVKYVQEHGILELNQALAQDKISIDKAQAIAHLPKEQQVAAIDLPRAKIENLLKKSSPAKEEEVEEAFPSEDFFKYCLEVFNGINRRKGTTEYHVIVSSSEIEVGLRILKIEKKSQAG